GGCGAPAWGSRGPLDVAAAACRSAYRSAAGLRFLPALAVEQLQGDLVRAPRARLDVGHRLLQPRLAVPPQVPPAVDVGDELTRVDLLERGHCNLEILEEPAHLARIGQGHER